VLDRCDKGRRWMLDQSAKLEGFHLHGKGSISRASEAAKLLEVLAEEQPAIAQRMAASRARRDPVVTDAVEVPDGSDGQTSGPNPRQDSV
jgi:hypothetical protein